MNSILNLLLYFYFSVAYNLHTGKCLYLNSTVRYPWTGRLCWIWGVYDTSRCRSSEDAQKCVLDRELHPRDWVLGVLCNVVLGMQMKWLIGETLENCPPPFLASGMWNLSSPTRGRTRIPCSESAVNHLTSKIPQGPSFWLKWPNTLMKTVIHSLQVCQLLPEWVTGLLFPVIMVSTYHTWGKNAKIKQRWLIAHIKTENYTNHTIY